MFKVSKRCSNVIFRVCCPLGLRHVDAKIHQDFVKIPFTKVYTLYKLSGHGKFTKFDSKSSYFLCQESFFTRKFVPFIYISHKYKMVLINYKFVEISLSSFADNKDGHYFEKQRIQHLHESQDINPVDT